jgi:hypothetical protein
MFNGLQVDELLAIFSTVDVMRITREQVASTKLNRIIAQVKQTYPTFDVRFGLLRPFSEQPDVNLLLSQ